MFLTIHKWFPHCLTYIIGVNIMRHLNRGFLWVSCIHCLQWFRIKNTQLKNVMLTIWLNVDERSIPHISGHLLRVRLSWEKKASADAFHLAANGVCIAQPCHRHGNTCAYDMSKAVVWGTCTMWHYSVLSSMQKPTTGKFLVLKKWNSLRGLLIHLPAWHLCTKCC